MNTYLIAATNSGFAVYDEITRTPVETHASASEAITSTLMRLSERGGCIRLSAGEFPLDTTITLGDNVRLSGEGRSTRVCLTESSDSGIAFSLTGVKGSMLTDMLISGKNGKKAHTGILLDGAGDCKLRSLWVTCFIKYGICLRNSCFLCQVTETTLSGNGVANCYIQKCIEGEYGDYVPNTLSQLTIYGGGKGIELNNAVVVNILGCTCYHNTGAAYHIHSWSNSVTLTGCRSFQIDGCAVIAQKANELNFSGNIFCWHTREGIRLTDCRWGTLTGNEIIDSGSHNPGGKNLTTKMADVSVPELYSGVILDDTRGFHLGGNAIFNWDVAPRMKHGIVEKPNCRKNLVVHNSINFYEKEPLVCEGAESMIKDNICEPAIHLEANPERIIQSFRLEKTRELIQELA